MLFHVHSLFVDESLLTCSHTSAVDGKTSLCLKMIEIFIIGRGGILVSIPNF